MKDFKKTCKKFCKKFWNLLWKDDSLKGWIFSILFLFILIKLILLPGLGLVAGTKLPLAIVESCSMYHHNGILSNYGEWWKRHEKKYQTYMVYENDFKEFPLKNGFNKGDILFITGAKPKDIQIGDIIIFQTEKKNPLIHRVIRKRKSNGEYIFSTIGDNNNGQLSIEQTIHENQILGKAKFIVAPLLGWGKLIFFEPFRTEYDRGLCVEN